MARTINCDAPGCAFVANYMVTVFTNGSTQGLCEAHWTLMCGAVIARAAGRELNTDEAEALIAAAAQPSAPSVDIPAGELWTCQLCGAEFPSEEMINEHVSGHTPAEYQAWVEANGGTLDENPPQRVSDLIPAGAESD